MSKPRRPEFVEERRSRGERSRSDTSHGTGRAEPPHPVHLTSLGAKHIPHPASEHTPRGGPATTRPAPIGEADGDRHTWMLTHGPTPGHSEATGTDRDACVRPVGFPRRPLIPVTSWVPFPAGRTPSLLSAGPVARRGVHELGTHQCRRNAKLWESSKTRPLSSPARRGQGRNHAIGPGADWHSSHAVTSRAVLGA
jgi:hypothetical protein